MKNKSTYSIRNDGKRRVININPRGFFARAFGAGFMFVWLSLWTVGCAVLIWTVIKHFSVFLFFFSFPFLAAWFFGAAILTKLLFANEKIFIDNIEVDVIKTCLITFYRKRVPVKEIEHIVIKKTGEDENGMEFDIELETIGTKLSVASGLNERKANDLADILRTQIPGLSDRAIKRVGSHDPTNDDGDDIALNARKRGPSDCRWEFETSFGNDTSFVNRGRFEIGKLLGLLFINLFWNGIIIVFMLAPFFDEVEQTQNFGWLIYIFLIPFVMIGLLMLYGLIVALLEPFRTSRFTFNDREITKTTSYFGLKFSRSWNLLGKAEMKLIVDRRSRPFSSEDQIDDGTHFAITFNHKASEITRMRQLTRGEADWISTLLEQEQSDYLVALT